MVISTVTVNMLINTITGRKSALPSHLRMLPSLTSFNHKRKITKVYSQSGFSNTYDRTHTSDVKELFLIKPTIRMNRSCQGCAHGLYLPMTNLDTILSQHG